MKTLHQLITEAHQKSGAPGMPINISGDADFYYAYVDGVAHPHRISHTNNSLSVHTSWKAYGARQFAETTIFADMKEVRELDWTMREQAKAMAKVWFKAQTAEPKAIFHLFYTKPVSGESMTPFIVAKEAPNNTWNRIETVHFGSDWTEFRAYSFALDMIRAFSQETDT